MKSLLLLFSEIDECSSNPCVHGTCRNEIDMYTCICDRGYESTHCDQGATICKILFFCIFIPSISIFGPKILVEKLLQSTFLRSNSVQHQRM